MAEAATATSVAASSGERAGARVQLELVTRIFDGRVHALRDVNLAIEPGEFVAISGPSGSGKSTLLHLIGGLDQPDEGTVLVDGADIAGQPHPARFRRHTIGFVFQLHHLLPSLTARGNVEVPLIAARVGRAERVARALELLEEVGLATRADHLPSQLSGGERQRVAVARAVANSPRLLLADEPTGALDSRSGARVLELLSHLRESRGMTVVVASHDPAVSELADRTVKLTDGRVVD